MGGLWRGAIRAKNVGTPSQSKKGGPDQSWLKESKKGLEAIGNRNRRTKRSWSLSGTAVT